MSTEPSRRPSAGQEPHGADSTKRPSTRQELNERLPLTLEQIGASVSPMTTRKKKKPGRVTKQAARVEAKRRIRRPEYVDIPIEGPSEQLVGWLRVEGHRIMWGNKETKKW